MDFIRSWFSGGSSEREPSHDTSTPETSTHSSTPPTNDDDISTSGQHNTPTKRVYVNEVPIGSEDGNHGLLSRVAKSVGVYHTNLSVESEDKVVTSGMGLSTGGGDKPLGKQTTSTDQTQRNRDEEKHGNLTKVPVEEYMGGKYKDVDPDVLEKQLEAQLEEKEPTGVYGTPQITEEGTLRPTICWTHTNNNLYRALPEETKQQMREENEERAERLGTMMAYSDFPGFPGTYGSTKD